MISVVDIFTFKDWFSLLNIICTIFFFSSEPGVIDTVIGDMSYLAFTKTIFIISSSCLYNINIGHNAGPHTGFPMLKPEWKKIPDWTKNCF